MENINAEEEISFYEYTPEDHAGFVACINDFYRGGYPYDIYLSADYLKRETESGSMIITIAKTKSGRIIGTSAAQRLSGIFEGSILLLLRCVISDYQGKGIATKQEIFLFDLIKKRFGDSLSLYADVMTHNNASQKTLTHQGFTLCGLRMMLYKSEIMVPKLGLPEGTKMSQAVYCKAYNKKSISIFAPEEHKEIIKSIYENLGLIPNFREYGKSFEDAIECGKYDAAKKPKHSSAEFYIEKPGKDFEKAFLPEIKELLAGGATAVAYINMEYPESLDVYKSLKKIGFYFTGIKPLSANGEYLIMSQTENCTCDLKYIALYEKQFDFINYIFGGKKDEKKQS